MELRQALAKQFELLTGDASERPALSDYIAAQEYPTKVATEAPYVRPQDKQKLLDLELAGAEATVNRLTALQDAYIQLEKTKNPAVRDEQAQKTAKEELAHWGQDHLRETGFVLIQNVAREIERVNDAATEITKHNAAEQSWQHLQAKFGEQYDFLFADKANDPDNAQRRDKYISDHANPSWKFDDDPSKRVAYADGEVTSYTQGLKDMKQLYIQELQIRNPDMSKADAEAKASDQVRQWAASQYNDHDRVFYASQVTEFHNTALKMEVDREQINHDLKVKDDQSKEALRTELAKQYDIIHPGGQGATPEGRDQYIAAGIAESQSHAHNTQQRNTYTQTVVAGNTAKLQELQKAYSDVQAERIVVGQIKPEQKDALVAKSMKMWENKGFATDMATYLNAGMHDEISRATAQLQTLEVKDYQRITQQVATLSGTVTTLQETNKTQGTQIEQLRTEATAGAGRETALAEKLAAAEKASAAMEVRLAEQTKLAERQQADMAAKLAEQTKKLEAQRQQLELQERALAEQKKTSPAVAVSVPPGTPVAGSVKAGPAASGPATPSTSASTTTPLATTTPTTTNTGVRTTSPASSPTPTASIATTRSGNPTGQVGTVTPEEMTVVSATHDALTYNMGKHAGVARGDGGTQTAILQSHFKLDVTGKADHKFHDKVVAYQHKHHLEPDGIVGMETVRSLIKDDHFNYAQEARNVQQHRDANPELHKFLNAVDTAVQQQVALRGAPKNNTVQTQPPMPAVKGHGIS